MKALEILGLATFLGIVGAVGSFEAEYTREAVCTNYSQGVYTFTDYNGNDWEWEEEPGDHFENGRTYVLTMDDMHSSQIEDDFIKFIQKK